MAIAVDVRRRAEVAHVERIDERVEARGESLVVGRVKPPVGLSVSASTIAWLLIAMIRVPRC